MRKRRINSCSQRHGLVAIAALESIVLPVEGDPVLVGRDQPAVGDRDAVGVAREIGEHRLRSGEGPLAVDEPPCPERREAGGEGIALAETGVLAEELQLAGGMRRGELVQHQPAKELESTRTGRKKLGWPRSTGASGEIPPPGTIMCRCG